MILYFECLIGDRRLDERLLLFVVEDLVGVRLGWQLLVLSVRRGIHALGFK